LIKTVKEVEQALLARIPEHQLRPRLEPTARAAALLGDPQKLYRIIHVTVTNGKTSTTRMIERLLREHSLRTGRFTSPHLTRLNERIAIDGESVSDEILVEIWNDIEPILGLVDAELDAEGELPLTYFEALTLLAFAIFADAPIDVLALEVGMGGEWDSTNVANGDVAVFTPIDWETPLLKLLKPRRELSNLARSWFQPLRSQPLLPNCRAKPKRGRIDLPPTDQTLKPSMWFPMVKVSASAFALSRGNTPTCSCHFTANTKPRMRLWPSPPLRHFLETGSDAFSTTSFGWLSPMWRRLAGCKFSVVTR
jgi:hypothetical protein